jgi:hypothetical protein
MEYNVTHTIRNARDVITKLVCSDGANIFDEASVKWMIFNRDKFYTIDDNGKKAYIHEIEGRSGFL